MVSRRSSSSSSGSSSHSITEQFENISEREKFWVEQYEFLESRGYRLRPRFRPGWVPSWKSTGQKAIDCEDARFHLHEYVMDATRLSDGRQVILKAVHRGSDEVRIAMMFSSAEALQDPMNHCVPILDFFGDTSVSGPDFLAMPLLLACDSPEFCIVSEVFDFIQQTLEGLNYMHRRGVAHRDLTRANIMMDAPDLFPNGFHPDPFWSIFSPDRFAMARSLQRSDVKIVKYYIIDFDISSYFEDDLAPRLVTGIDGRDREVPELDLKKPYDPFAVDIYTLGNTYRELFHGFKNLGFLSPLISEMTNKRPEDRPNAEQALALYRRIVNETGRALVHKRLRPSDEPIVVHYILELSSSLDSFLQAMQHAITSRNITFVLIPIGISALLLFRGNHHRFGGLRYLFTGIWRTKR